MTETTMYDNILQEMNDIKVGLLVMGRDRPGFDQEWGGQMEKKVVNTLRDTTYDVYFLDHSVTNDRSLRDAVDEYKNEGVNVLTVIQPTMADGKLAPMLAQQWRNPIVFWATPEREESVSSNSLVGTHIYMSTMRQKKHPCELVYGMPGYEDTDKQLHEAIRCTYTVSKLRDSKIGLVGFHAPGFVDMSPDPYLLSDVFNVEMSHTSIPDFIDTVESLPEQKIKDDVNQVLDLSLPLDDVSVNELSLASRYYLALCKHLKRDNLDGIAIREWSELSSELGQWPYLAIARLLSEGRAVAMEGDVDGSLSCLIGSFLGCGPVYISDWLEHNDDVIALWHTGNAPFQLCKPIGDERGPRISRHFNNNSPAVVDADLNPHMPITIFRIWHCENEYKIASFEAETIDPPKQLKGTNGFARVDDLSINSLFRKLCMEGMPHHVSVVEGHHSELLKRLADQLDLSVVSV